MPALLTDLDRTLTGADLKLDAGVIPRLRELRAAGIPVIVVTGRVLDHLVDMGLTTEVDAIVAENGAVLAIPADAPPELAEPDWRDRAVTALGPLASSFTWGRVLGSGHRKTAPDAAAALERHHIPHVLSYNAEEVMLLPAGVDKSAGAKRALSRLGLTPDDAWAIGDGENDIPLLTLAKWGAAPANAHPAVKAVATIQLEQPYSAAFLELTGRMLREID